MPSGIEGTVIDVKVFTREDVPKDSRAKEIQSMEIEKMRKDYSDELRIYENDIFNRVKHLILNKVVVGGPNALKPGMKVTKSYLQRLQRDKWFNIRMHKETVSRQLERLAQTANTTGR